MVSRYYYMNIAFKVHANKSRRSTFHLLLRNLIYSHVLHVFHPVGFQRPPMGMGPPRMAMQMPPRPGFMPPQPPMGMRQPMPPRPPAPPSRPDDEPPMKKARTEDSLLPERVFLDTHKVVMDIKILFLIEKNTSFA